MAESTYAANVIHLDSDEGELIGGGIEQELTSPFTASIDESRITISHTNGFNFTFTPAEDTELGIGNYLNAEKLPFNSPKSPGMDVSNTGNDCDSVSGEFYIHEIDFSETSPVLALDFVQYCDSDSAKLTGNIRINSEIEAPYPHSIGIVNLSTSSAPEGTTIVATTNPSIIQNEPYTVSWQQISGPTVEFLQADEKVTEIKLPESIKLGGEEIIIQASILDAEENIITASDSVHVSSKSDPLTYLWFSSDDEETIVQGKNEYLDLSNSLFNLSNNEQNGVSLVVKNNNYWLVDFAAANQQALKTETYDNASHFPDQASDIPGLNFSNDERECSNSSGEFEILQLAYSTNELPETFQASFKQRCVPAEEVDESTPSLWGEIAINAIHLSAPRASAGGDIEVDEGETVNLNGSNSSDKEDDISSYVWSADDSSVTISDNDEVKASFTAPELDNGEDSKTITVELLLTDKEGYQGKDEVIVTVLADNEAPLAKNDTVEVEIGTTSDINLLSNDEDEDGYLQNDSITIVKKPTYGNAVIYSSGIITYQPTVTTATTDTITYSVKDNDGAVSNTATINITISEEVSDSDNAGDDESDGTDSEDEEEVVYAGSFDLLFMMSLLLMYLRHRYFPAKKE